MQEGHFIPRFLLCGAIIAGIVLGIFTLKNWSENKIVLAEISKQCSEGKKPVYKNGESFFFGSCKGTPKSRETKCIEKDLPVFTVESEDGEKYRVRGECAKPKPQPGRNKSYK